VGMTHASAASTITAAGLTVGAVTSQSSATVASGLVISESPTAGTSITSGSAVSLVVSSGGAIGAAGGSWTWISGLDLADTLAGDAYGVDGTKGVASISNEPGSRYGAATWTDSSGNFWLFGGYGCGIGSASVGGCDGPNPAIHPTQPPGYLNDLWKFTPATGQWTWVSGSSIASSGDNEGVGGVYGTQGTPGPTNTPGPRTGAVSWTDSVGNLWLFGGSGLGTDLSLYGYGPLNDLWKFSPSIGEWTWVGGSNVIGVDGVYGVQGVASAGNTPGSRSQAVSWVDPSGNFWLFGGSGCDSSGCAVPGGECGDGFICGGDVQGGLNDLWEFSPITGLWTWVSGSDVACSNGTEASCSGAHGAQGLASASNVPPTFWGGNAWTDSSGNLWMLGGGCFTPSFALATACTAMWMYSPSTDQWTWVSGSNVVSPAEPYSDYINGTSGVYGTQGTASANNIPGSRLYASSWTDSAGNFWLFGGTGVDSARASGLLDDLWKYSPGTGQWTWVSGSNLACVDINNTNLSCIGNFGSQGMASASNVPEGRNSAGAWIDAADNLWLFGGGSLGDAYSLNDLWKFAPGQ
jgi:hypothetical protein